MIFKNLTEKHTVTLLDRSTNEAVRVFPNEGTSIRVHQVVESLEVVDGVPITRNTYGPTVNLPPREEGVLLIVSALVLTANPDRDDLICPNESARGPNGQIIGCYSLAKL
jgi:hypothetical protein